MKREKEDPRNHTFLAKVNHAVGVFVNGVEVSILVLCIAALGILLIANVFARTFFQSIYFAEEVAKFLVILTTFTGVSYGVRKARHIRMGAFLDAMSPQLEKAFIIMILNFRRSEISITY
ncbi:MAG: TRAP transporter small permease subunit [Deltaproteobacteria bacterium]|nr:TRAP transporter small permease subunit [Deltaproteobacteria bacterium]